MKIELSSVRGARVGEQIVLVERTVIRLGRQRDNDVVFDAQKDLLVSGYHAEMRRMADGLHLVDLRSANGTFIGEARIADALLFDGQEVTFGPGGSALSMIAQGLCAALAQGLCAALA